jgi:hypothetical protein
MSWGACCVTAATADVLRRTIAGTCTTRTHTVLCGLALPRVSSIVAKRPWKPANSKLIPPPSSRSVPQRANFIFFFWWFHEMWKGTSLREDLADAQMKRGALLLLLAGAGAAQTCAPWSVSRPSPVVAARPLAQRRSGDGGEGLREER